MINKQDLINRALAIFKQVAPVRTGLFSIWIKAEPTEDGFIVYVDSSEVDYAEHVLTDSPRNPNAGWTEEAAEIFALILSQLLQAHIREDTEEDN